VAPRSRSVRSLFGLRCGGDDVGEERGGPPRGLHVPQAPLRPRHVRQPDGRSRRSPGGLPSVSKTTMQAAHRGTASKHFFEFFFAGGDE